MWLEAIISQADFVTVFDRLLPVKIYLHDEGEEDKERWLRLDKARLVTLVPEEGLRVMCPAELQWHIAGLSPRVKLDELQVLFRPEVAEKHKGGVLDFNIEVEEAAFHSLPEFIDTPIVKAVNAALAKKKPAWKFSETLTRTVDLGKLLDPVEALRIEASWGKLRVTAEALALVISIDLDFVRND